MPHVTTGTKMQINGLTPPLRYAHYCPIDPYERDREREKATEIQTQRQTETDRDKERASLDYIPLT